MNGVGLKSRSVHRVDKMQTEEMKIFLVEFEAVIGKSAESFKGDPKGFANALNKHAVLRSNFRKAVDVPLEDANAAGLANLFGG